MGIGKHVVGFRPADDLWLRMKAAWDACVLAGTQPPKEVIDFFDGEHPGDAPGKEVGIKGENAVREWASFGREGFDVDIEALPPGVRYVRFYLSW